MKLEGEVALITGGTGGLVGAVIGLILLFFLATDDAGIINCAVLPVYGLA